MLSTRLGTIDIYVVSGIFPLKRTTTSIRDKLSLPQRLNDVLGYIGNLSQAVDDSELFDFFWFRKVWDALIEYMCISFSTVVEVRKAYCKGV